MGKFLLWCILLVLVLYPFVWLILLPFRLLGIVVTGTLEFFRSLIMLPARLLGGRSHA